MVEIWRGLIQWLSILYGHDDPNRYRNFGKFLESIVYVEGSMVVRRGGWRATISTPTYEELLSQIRQELHLRFTQH